MLAPTSSTRTLRMLPCSCTPCIAWLKCWNSNPLACHGTARYGRRGHALARAASDTRAGALPTAIIYLILLLLRLCGGALESHKSFRVNEADERESTFQDVPRPLPGRAQGGRHYTMRHHIDAAGDVVHHRWHVIALPRFVSPAPLWHP